MAKKKDRIAERLAAISSAKPVVIDAPPETPRKKKRADRAERATVFRPGKIYIAKDKSIPCVVRDISDGGARIAMEAMFPLPPVVVLLVPQAGLKKKARVVWQNETESGLEFLADSRRSKK